MQLKKLPETKKEKTKTKKKKNFENFYVEICQFFLILDQIMLYQITLDKLGFIPNWF
jgi:hypothetical protein